MRHALRVGVRSLAVLASVVEALGASSPTLAPPHTDVARAAIRRLGVDAHSASVLSILLERLGVAHDAFSPRIPAWNAADVCARCGMMTAR